MGHEKNDPVIQLVMGCDHCASKFKVMRGDDAKLKIYVLSYAYCVECGKLDIHC